MPNMFSETRFTDSIRDIAIVGSGLAGLTLGHCLRQHGQKVTLFEKARGPGGRLASKRAGGASVDIGAQYFTIRNEAFMDFLERKAGPAAFGAWDGNFRDRNASGDWHPSSREARYTGIPRMSAISRALSEGLEVKSGQRVTRLSRVSQQRWLIETESGDLGPYDSVLLTAPVQQCRDLLHASDLGELGGKLSNPQFDLQPCWAVALHFPESLGLPTDGAKLQDPVLGWIANNTSKPGRDATGEWWVVHATAEWSARHQDLPGEEVVRLLARAFSRLTDTRRQASESLSHRWLYAKAGSAGEGSLWWPTEGIGIAGDWLCGGRVEAAYESAAHLAEQITGSVPDRSE